MIAGLLRNRWALAELFAASNLGFLALDIYVAHSINAFAHPAEWVPFGFSLGAPVLLALDWLGRARGLRRLRFVGHLVGWLAVAVGIVGLALHLDSRFFVEWTVRSLVYTAPFAAPLAYAGIGLLILLDRVTPPTDRGWSNSVVLLALGGFAGNFALSWADHAQNGFFHPSEWVPVIASAIAIGCLAAMLRYRDDPLLRRTTWVVLIAQIAVGIAGFALHGWANLNGPDHLWADFVFGAPIFAPLLFADLALLGAIGISSHSPERYE